MNMLTCERLAESLDRNLLETGDHKWRQLSTKSRRVPNILRLARQQKDAML